MKTSYFFNSVKDFPIATLMEPTVYSGTINASEISVSNDRAKSLEAELNTRMDIMDQTAMVTITDLHGTIMYANDLFCSVTGFSRKEVIGHSHNLIRHPDLRDETVDSLWKLIRKGETWQGMMKSKNKAGHNFWTKTTIAPVMDEFGQPIKYVWVRHDITDLKQTEFELYEAKQRADQQLLDNLKNAHRIQSAILPSEDDLLKLFPAAFLYSSPQQSVSGDFYWFNKSGDETIFILGDGTGHGVSGSFVSLIALSALEFIVKGKNETDPGKILTELNDFLFRALNKHKGSTLTESIDMSVCTYNHKTKEMRYASGKSKIYVVKDGELYCLDREDCSIGSLNGNDCSIESKAITMERGDRVYMMSDGFSDQFGGENNKRYGSRQVKKLLANTSYLSIKDQKELIRKSFLAWKGENEQTDDISLLGFRVD